jgi:hypothetical protein
MNALQASVNVRELCLAFVVSCRIAKGGVSAVSALLDAGEMVEFCDYRSTSGGARLSLPLAA